MVKALVTAMLVLVLVDLAVDHGAYTQIVLGIFGSFFQWLTHMGDDTIFAK